jgi:RNA recognition motif-containing protein
VFYQFIYLIIIILMNIFVAGLNYKISEAELGDLFAEYGEIASVKLVTERETGRSKGYGFVEMTDEEAGKKAIEALNGAEIDGRTIAVSEARPRSEEAPRRNNYGGGNRGGYGGGNRGGYGGGGGRY